jgi:hypothetical protein
VLEINFNAMILSKALYQGLKCQNFGQFLVRPKEKKVGIDCMHFTLQLSTPG